MLSGRFLTGAARFFLRSACHDWFRECSPATIRCMSSSHELLDFNESRRRRWNLTILLTMYAGYVAFMLCRNTLIAASPAMIADPTLGLDKETYGQVMSWHSAGAIAGKIVTGLGADALGGRIMFLLALALTAVSNIAFGLVSSVPLFKLFNFSGQFSKAGGWPAMAKLVGHWYPPANHGRVWSIISTSSRVGTMTALFLVGSLLTVGSWRTAFFLTAGITLLIALAGYFLLKERPQDVSLAPLEEDPVDSGAHPLDGTTLDQACFAFACSARFWLICLSLGCLCVLVDFLTFLPLYLFETLSIPETKASIYSTSFLAGMFIALIAAGVFYDRFSKRQLTWVMSGLLACGTACVYLLSIYPDMQLADQARTFTVVATLFTFGFTIATAYYIPMSVFAVAFGGPHSGFLISLIDIFGYAAALIFTYFGGTLAQDYGWTVFLNVLLTVAILATTSMTAFLYLDARAE